MRKNRKTHLTVFFASILAFAVLIAAYTQDIANNLTLGLDLQGGFEIVYEVSPLEENGTLPDMEVVASSISKRVDVLGVSEPQIVIEGDDRVRVQLAGVSNQEQARRMISSTANLTFRDVNDNLLADSSIIEEGGASLGYENGLPIVSLKIADKEKFAEITGDLAANASGQNMIVTWLDFEEGDTYATEIANEDPNYVPKFISAASVTTQITGDAIIQGGFSEEEARELADLINSGSLPVKMTEIYSNVVSAEYGVGAFNLTATAGIIGVGLVALFMILSYRMLGVLTAGILCLYVFSVFTIYNFMGGVFTLPGIAALVLGVGMTVDANIITYERIKDELYMGRTVTNAVKEGQSLAFVTIFDAQFTTFMAALIMYIFGIGSVKGFATMLMVTLISTMIFNVVVSRFLLNQLTKSGVLDQRKSWFGVKESRIPDVSKGEEQTYFGPFKNVDFMKKSTAVILISGLIFVASIARSGFQVANGNDALNLGIDFSSGTKITVTSNEDITVEEVSEVFDTKDVTVSSYQQSGNNIVNVTIKEALSSEQLDDIKSVFVERYGIEPNDNVVTPVVGRELVSNAIALSLLAWVVMLIYITIRFKWDYAISCIVALVHDVGIVLAVFALLRFEINIELISVCLAIIGYSINNSIVVFDRVREVVEERKDEQLTNKDYKDIVNQALDKTLVRSVFSSITTIFPVIALLVLGSSAIFTFNTAMFIGLIAGTVSSIFVAPRVWLEIRSRHKPKAKKKKAVKKEALDEVSIPGINA